MKRTICKMYMGNTPAQVFAKGQVLHGFEPDSDAVEYKSDRAKALYDALGADVEDMEYTLGSLPDGTWAVVGLEVTGHPFVFEV